MPERVRVSTSRGLRLRDSARDGVVLRVLPNGETVEVLSRETWLRVRTNDSKIGFVLGDFTEPVSTTSTAEPDIIVFEHPRFGGDVLRIHRDFRPAAELIGRLAEEHNVNLHITSGLREPNRAVPGAVVEPAKFSNHHAGHALDMNLIVDGRLYNSTKLASLGSLPESARKFLEKVRSTQPLRWGADFSDPDPVHIDDGLNKRDPTGFERKVRAIWRV